MKIWNWRRELSCLALFFQSITTFATWSSLQTNNPPNSNCHQLTQISIFRTWLVHSQFIVTALFSARTSLFLWILWSHQIQRDRGRKRWSGRTMSSVPLAVVSSRGQNLQRLCLRPTGLWSNYLLGSKFSNCLLNSFRMKWAITRFSKLGVLHLAVPSASMLPKIWRRVSHHLTGTVSGSS